MTDHLRFGIFLPPYHRSDQNPSLAIHRDLELVELWGRLGFDDVRVVEAAKRRYAPDRPQS
jgi:limonene 1,2-monooxygenase